MLIRIEHEFGNVFVIVALIKIFLVLIWGKEHLHAVVSGWKEPQRPILNMVAVDEEEIEALSIVLGIV